MEPSGSQWRKDPNASDLVVTLRPATPADRAFVESVYFETQRWIIERLFGLRGDEVERQKFNEVYDERISSIICCENRAVGWLSVITGATTVEIGHLYLLPEYQRRGIGSFLIRRVIEAARASGLRVRISTAKINPALELYERLGFQHVGESEFKTYMELQ
jgi:ribosomal protein S18 acetylase RimI-like enzyme